MANGRSETTEIPDHIRVQVDERDGRRCRMCSKYLGERRALHHIMYGGDLQGMGGRRLHEVHNLLTVCWLPFDNGCHDRLHSDKQYWQPLAMQAARVPNVTVLQLNRWRQAQQGADDEHIRRRAERGEDPFGDADDWAGV